MIFKCIAFVAFASHGYVWAEAFEAKELVEIAITRNPELKALRLEVEAHSNLAEQEARWENPSLELGADQKHQPVGRTDFMKIGLSQEFMRPSRRNAKVNSAKAAADLSRVQQDESEIHIRNEVLKLIYEYRAATEKAEHAKERLQRFRTVGTYLHSRVFAAPQKQAEASIVRSKLLLLGRQFRELEAGRKIAWNKLNLYLGLKSEPTIKAEWFPSGQPLAFEHLFEKAKTYSPDIREQKFKIAQAESERKIAQTNYFPGLKLNATFADGKGEDPEKVYGLGVSIPLPVWNFYGSAVRGSESQANAERMRLGWAEERTAQELRSALEKYSAARISLDELKIEDVTKLEKEMRSIDQNFKRGQVDLLVYIEADAEHFDSLNAIFESQVEYVAARAAIYEIVGQAPFAAE